MVQSSDFAKPVTSQFRFDGFAGSCEYDDDYGYGTIKGEGSFPAKRLSASH
jgi:hypothetical protein